MNQLSSNSISVALFLITLLILVPTRAAGEEALHGNVPELVSQAKKGLSVSLTKKQATIPGTILAILPESGRKIFFEAFDAARNEIKIEICVLEDPQILEHLQSALQRGVRVRVIVDRGKYGAPGSLEPANLQQYLVNSGGKLHLSNSIFPRSFPKIILVDSKFFLIGSACLDTTTFQKYRDFVHVGHQSSMIKELNTLFENDWSYSAAPGEPPPYFNPSPKLNEKNLIVSPVNSSAKLVSFYQNAKKTLDVYTELLGNPTLEGELAAAARRGVKVRLIAPITVNGGDSVLQHTHLESLAHLKEAGLSIRTSGPDESFEKPYMHARAAIADGRTVFLGSISLSPDSATVNREAGIISKDAALSKALADQFNKDYSSLVQR